MGHPVRAVGVRDVGSYSGRIASLASVSDVIDTPTGARYSPTMTDAEFRAFVAHARAEVAAELARIEALDWSAMTAAEHRAYRSVRS